MKGRTLSDIEESILNNVIRSTDVGMAHHLIQDIIYIDVIWVRIQYSVHMQRLRQQSIGISQFNVPSSIQAPIISIRTRKYP